MKNLRAAVLLLLSISVATTACLEVIPYSPQPAKEADPLKALDETVRFGVDVPTKVEADEMPTPGPRAIPNRPGSGVSGRVAAGSARSAKSGRSLLALFLLALVAAAAGGIFVMKCERDQSARSDNRVTLP